jgi:hypothetical protein
MLLNNSRIEKQNSDYESRTGIKSLKSILLEQEKFKKMSEKGLLDNEQLAQIGLSQS